MELGQRLHSAIHDIYVVETNGWPVELVDRVANRLQADIDEADRLRVEVPWMEAFTVFTAPGNYIYVSRRLLEVCRTEETVAFVIAHEIAHHRLGHLDVFPDWLADIPGAHIAVFLAALYRSIEARLYGPEAEAQADRSAIDLCIKAGYEANKCLEIFEVLEKFALDMRDLDMVFGPEEDNTTNWLRMHPFPRSFASGFGSARAATCPSETGGRRLCGILSRELLPDRMRPSRVRRVSGVANDRRLTTRWSERGEDKVVSFLITQQRAAQR
jgi:predicted Zn-dependent protease